jgi:tetratricopeptide (TPR) repeat protein
VPAVRDAFTASLGDMTIGPRIARPVDRDRQLAGDVWFYYGSRYGEYLTAAKQSGAEDYLPAMVEGTPGRSESYFTLAEDFADAGNLTAAAADYRYALELNPARADVHDRLAVLASKAGRNDEAIAEWKLAIAAFARLMDRPRVPGRFWTDLADTLRHIGEAKALPSVRDDVEKLLRTYIRRNGNYQVDVLLEAAVAASADVAAGVAWIAELSRSAANPAQFVSALIDRPWIPDAQRDVLYARIVEASDLRVSQTFGDQRENAQQEAWSRRIEWAKFLVGRRRNDRARTVWQRCGEDEKVAWEAKSSCSTCCLPRAAGSSPHCWRVIGASARRRVAACSHRSSQGRRRRLFATRARIYLRPRFENGEGSMPQRSSGSPKSASKRKTSREHWPFCDA